jgi:hypothetical protein
MTNLYDPLPTTIRQALERGGYRLPRKGHSPWGWAGCWAIAQVIILMTAYGFAGFAGRSLDVRMVCAFVIVWLMNWAMSRERHSMKIFYWSRVPDGLVSTTQKEVIASYGALITCLSMTLFAAGGILCATIAQRAAEWGIPLDWRVGVLIAFAIVHLEYRPCAVFSLKLYNRWLKSLMLDDRRDETAGA